MANVIPKHGDVLKVRATMKNNKLAVWHFGIYTEEGTVIDHGPDGTHERSFSDFSGGGTVYVQRHKNPLVSRAEVVRRARSLIGKLRYNAISLNCEQFVNWCRRNRMVSQQVREGVGVAALCLLCLIGFVAAIRSTN